VDAHNYDGGDTGRIDDPLTTSLPSDIWKKQPITSDWNIRTARRRLLIRCVMLTWGREIVGDVGVEE
jgi:hypothetical protein